MRDNHDGYPEIVSAHERDGQFFGAVRVSHSGEAATLKFGVSHAAYSEIKKIQCPKELLETLLWFTRLTSLEETCHLRRTND